MSALDPFALGGRQDADAKALALWQRWLDDGRAIDGAPDKCESETPIYEAALARQDETECEILALSGEMLVLAIKTFLYLRHFDDVGSAWVPREGLLRCKEPFDDTRHHPIGELAYAISMLRDLATVLPEVEELAAPVIHPDAELIDLDINIEWAHTVLGATEAATSCPGSLRRREEWRRETETKLAGWLDRVSTIEAGTKRGETIKTRHASR